MGRPEAPEPLGQTSSTTSVSGTKTAGETLARKVAKSVSSDIKDIVKQSVSDGVKLDDQYLDERLSQNKYLQEISKKLHPAVDRIQTAQNKTSKLSRELEVAKRKDRGRIEALLTEAKTEQRAAILDMYAQSKILGRFVAGNDSSKVITRPVDGISVKTYATAIGDAISSAAYQTRNVDNRRR